MIETTGTVSVTKNSPIVTGQGTRFTRLQPGMFFRVEGAGFSYQVARVDSDVSLVLSGEILSESGSDLAYVASLEFTPFLSVPIPTDSDTDSNAVIVRGLREIDRAARLFDPD